VSAEPPERRSALRELALFGACGGLLIAVLKWAEYRFLVIEHSLAVYGGLVAVLFAGVGIWAGWTLTGKKPEVIVKEVHVPVPVVGPFVRDDRRVAELGITPRELEILELIASGLSNREIAEKLFVSENTVKTHSSRLFEKLDAKRRTQAVQIAKDARLIP
jgi:DNA-binding CsgD family transcriptional regulator